MRKVPHKTGLTIMGKRIQHRPVRLGVVLLTLACLLLGTASPAGASDSDGTGGGNIYGVHPAPALYPPLNPLTPCAGYDYLHYTSVEPNTGVSDYTVAYSVNGVPYVGLVKTEYSVGEAGDGQLIYEGPGGSYATLADCRLGILPGAPYSVRTTGGYIESIPPGGLRCDYTGGTYSRVGTVATVTLDGGCTLPTTGSTHEQRVADHVPVGPAPTRTVGVEALVVT